MTQNLKLGELFNIQIGKTPQRGDASMWDKKKRTKNIWLSIKDLNQSDEKGYISDSSEYISDKATHLVKLIPENTLLLSFKLTLGRTAISKVPLRTNEAIAALIPKTEKCNIKFLKYYFEFFDFEAYSKNDFKIKGLTLNKKKLAEIPIRIPSLKDQEKIINKLDKTFERTNNYKLKIDESLINAKKLFLSVLDKEFKPKGNERSQLKKLSEISAIKGGKRVPKGYKLLDKKTQFPYIRVTDFNNNGGIDESNLKFIDETIHNQIKNYTIHSCDLFISIAGTVGKSGMVPNHLDGANLTENACKLIFEDNTHNKFIYYFTKSSFFKNQVLEKTKTASQPKLALSRLGEIVLQLPPLEDQLELTNKFIEVEKYINTLMSKKDALMFELDLLKKSVLNKEFSHVE